MIKKIFIKIARILNFELIDQNNFESPTLETKINGDLSNNEKSIVLPLGKVNLTKKIKHLKIIFRTNSNVHIWDQNKKRIFDQPKIEYAKRSLYSILKSIKKLNEKYPSIKVNLDVVDDNSKKNNLDQLKKILSEQEINYKIINHDNSEHRSEIKEQKNIETYSNLSSLLKCYQLGKDEGEDIIYFVEDDYIHFKSSLEEMIGTYERISSQLNKELFICPADYPYLYTDNEKTNLLIGNKRHWRTINKTLCTFMTSKILLDKYWENFYKTCLDRNNPFEKYLN